jgi:DNA polymerase III alpha subunit
MMRIRTGASFHVAYGHINEVIKRLKTIGWKYAPVSDTNSTFAFNRYAHLCEKEGLRPIFGVELAVAPTEELGKKRIVADYWSFFAIKDLKPLHDLIGVATRFDTPAIDYAIALEVKGLIKIAGNRTMLKYVKGKPKDFYMALSPSTPFGLYREAKKRGFQFLASSDNLFPEAEDLETYRIMRGKAANTQTYPQHILSDAEWHEACYMFDKKDRDAAIKNREAVMKRCTAKLEKAQIYKPERPKTLLAMCQEGAKRVGVNLKDPVYAARLERELKLIKDKEFEDYFYIIADIVSHAKRIMIVGPARGSSCGSLVCYLLDITAIDPIKFNLIFERFIDINRNDLPDIDIDFDDQQREHIFNYVKKKYKREHVARLGTVGTFRPKSALNQIGKALRIPQWRINKVSESMIIRSGGDSRALQQLEDTLNETEAGRTLLTEYPLALMGARLEGHPNASSQHAAGVCVTSEPIDRYVAIDARSNSTMCDKKDAEDYNMLKIDMLGLTQLSIFARAMELINIKPVSGWLEKLPLDDQAAFDILNRRFYSGVFQFNGAALQSLAKQVTINDIEDIISLTALARPGPLASGGANNWVKRHNSEQEVTYPHQLFEPYLSNTLGVVCYQEQIMEICRNVGDLSWADVSTLRKAMSKSLGKEYFDQFGIRFIPAAVKKGIPKAIAAKAWDDACQFGSWAFNRSHAVAYGHISYWCAWWKAHHPVEFAAATLDAEALPLRQIMILRELEAEGIRYVPVDPHYSEGRWTIQEDDEGKYLVGPLTMIHKIGPKKMDEIITARREGRALPDNIIKLLRASKTDIDSLYPISDAINMIDLPAKGVSSIPTMVEDAQCGTRGPIVIVGLITRVAPRDENDQQNVNKRGYALQGPHMALNMFLRDDTDEIFCKIDRFLYETLGREVIEKTRTGRSLWAFKGTVPPRFRMLSVDRIQFLGDIDTILRPNDTGGKTPESQAAGFAKAQGAGVGGREEDEE